MIATVPPEIAFVGMPSMDTVPPEMAFDGRPVIDTVPPEIAFVGMPPIDTVPPEMAFDGRVAETYPPVISNETVPAVIFTPEMAPCGMSTDTATPLMAFSGMQSSV